MGTYANFYNSDNGDRVYDADSFGEWLRPFFKTGVFNGELQVLASSGMEVIVDTGNAFIEGKLKKFDSQTTLTVEQASANSTRIDSVICRRNDTDRDFTLMIVKGTTVAPLPVRENGIYDIVLAHITVPASAVEIKQENITDTRMNADICGWVVSNVEEVDFSQVSAQWADYIANFEADELQAFNEWFDTIKGQLSTDQAGSLQLQIDEQANKIATNTANISANKADIDSISADITSLQQTTQTNTNDIQAIKARDDEQDSNISSLEERLYKVNDGENTIKANGGSIRGIKLYGRSVQDGTPTPDNPIDIQSVVNPKLEVCGKNLFNVNGNISRQNGSLIISDNKITATLDNNYNGNYVMWSKKYPSGTYTIKLTLKKDGTVYPFRFLCDKEYTSKQGTVKFNEYYKAYINKDSLNSEANFTVNEPFSLGLVLGYPNSMTGDTVEISEIQVEKGEVATDYELYKEQSATLPYTLNAIPVTSGGNVTIDGQQYIADYVDIDKKQLVRITKKSVFNGIENWELINSNNDTYCFKQSNPLENSLLDNYSKNYLCNRTVSNTTTANNDTIGSYIFQSNFRIRVPSAIATDVNGFKSWLTNNNITVLYPIATPTIINLTDEEVQAFKSLHTYEGVTNIIDSSDQISGSHKFIYDIADIIDNQCANIDKLNQLKPVTLGTTWTQDTANGYYTQSVAFGGITSKDNPTIDVVLIGTLAEMQAQQEEWGKILKIETSTDTLTFYASEPTTVSLSVMVKGV